MVIIKDYIDPSRLLFKSICNTYAIVLLWILKIKKVKQKMCVNVMISTRSHWSKKKWKKKKMQT